MLTTKSVMEAIANDVTTNDIAVKGSVVVSDKWGTTINLDVSDEYLPKCIAEMRVCLLGCAKTMDEEGEYFIPVSIFADYLDEHDGKMHRYHDRYSVYNEAVGPAEVMNALLWEVGDKSLHDYFDRITCCN